MQNSADHMDVLADSSNKSKVKVLIPVVLILVVVGALFSISSSKLDANPPSKPIATTDAPGASTGGASWCRTQAWVDNVLAHRAMGEWWYELGTYDIDFLIRMGGQICKPRPLNPSIKLSDNCQNAVITVALLVDRSNSVIADGSSATPGIFKQSINTLINEFYDRFTPSPRNGQINFLIYAFGTKAVLQNNTTSGSPVLGSPTLITDASTPSGRAAMLDTISKIHFRNEEVPAFRNKNLDLNGFQHSDGSPYQRQRAYNVGSETKGGEYGKTNWQDAFINVMDAASSPKYNHPGDAGIGKRIDLAVMVTDGLPTADNGNDWTWQAGTYRGTDTVSYNPASDGYSLSNPTDVSNWNSQYTDQDDLYRITTDQGGRVSSERAVDMLRSGDNPRDTSSAARSIAKRPPISVKGIVVTTNPSQQERNKSLNYAKSVFGEGNFFFATSFTSGPAPDTLESQIKSLVTNVIEESSCPEFNTPIHPGITITADLDTVTPTEGDPTGQTVTYTVRNSSDGGDLRGVIVCLGTSADIDTSTGTPRCVNGTVQYIGDMAEGGTYTFQYNVHVPLGSPISDFKVAVIGISTATPDELYDPATGTTSSAFPTGSEIVGVDTIRVRLPS